MIMMARMIPAASIDGRRSDPGRREKAERLAQERKRGTAERGTSTRFPESVDDAGIAASSPIRNATGWRTTLGANSVR
jgi:hypothetical protein